MPEQPVSFCERCGRPVEPRHRVVVRAGLGPQRIEHDYCARKYSGTPVHYKRHPDRSLATAHEGFTHVYDGRIDVYNVTWMEEALEGREPDEVTVAPWVVGGLIANGIRPEDAAEVVAIQQAVGRAERPIIVVVWTDGRSIIVDGSHRVVEAGVQGRFKHPAHILTFEEAAPFRIDDVPDWLVELGRVG